jgi:hypothetical protein
MKAWQGRYAFRSASLRPFSFKYLKAILPVMPVVVIDHGPVTLPNTPPPPATGRLPVPPTPGLSLDVELTDFSDHFYIRVESANYQFITTITATGSHAHAGDRVNYGLLKQWLSDPQTQTTVINCIMEPENIKRGILLALTQYIDQQLANPSRPAPPAQGKPGDPGTDPA